MYRNGYAFKLDNVAEYTEITQLFDQYKICMVKVRFTFNGWPQNIQTIAAASTVTIPRFHWVIDQTDNSTPAAIADIRSYSNYKVVQLMAGKPVKIIIRPRTKINNLNGYIVGRPQWIATSDATAAHYGLKTIIDATYANGTSGEVVGTITEDWTYYIAAKSTK